MDDWEFVEVLAGQTLSCSAVRSALYILLTWPAPSSCSLGRLAAIWAAYIAFAWNEAYPEKSSAYRGQFCRCD